MERPSIDDTITPGQPCQCEFTPYDNPDDPDEESCHYKRKCKYCGYVWFGLHCPHDGYQNPCPRCGVTPKIIPEYTQ